MERRKRKEAGSGSNHNGTVVKWRGSEKDADEKLRFHFGVKAHANLHELLKTHLPLNDVKQTGQKVEFGMRIAHGAFQGTLNKEGTELAGQFTHEANSVPLTLRKKAGQPPK